MARINGVNSDYKYSETEKGVIEVKPQPAILEMKLFICPYDKPSSLEPLAGESSHCQGSNTQCPESGPTTNGHAMIHLHQSKGIELIADDDNKITIAQNGNINLRPVNTATVNGPFQVRRKGGAQTLFFNITNTQVRIESGGGAVIVLQADGGIELKPKSGRKVTVTGNMEVTGTLDATLV